MSDAEQLGARLIDLHNSGGLTAGTGGALVRDAAAAEAMRARCRRLAQIHRRLGMAYDLRARATTPEMQDAADRSIGNLQAELKHVEA